MSSTIQRRVFLLLLCAFIALALAYSVVIPLGEAPDEVSHWSYVEYLIEHWQLPPAKGPVSGEAHQPPLYYGISALATGWIEQAPFQIIANPDFTLADPQSPNLLLHTQRESFPYRGVPLAWHLARALSALMGAVTVWATYRIAGELFPGDAWLALGTAAFVAFLPGFLFICAVVNNDNLVVMLSTLSLVPIIRVVRGSSSRRQVALLGLVLGLTLLTKLSGIIVWLMAALAFCVAAQRNWKQAAGDFALCFGIAIGLATPLLVSNLQRYGDPLAWSAYLSVASIRQTAITRQGWIDIAEGLFTSFWGRFGGALQLEMPPIIYAVTGIAGFFALAGWLAHVRDARRDQLIVGIRPLAILFVTFWLMLFALYIRWAITDLAAGQMRLLFPGLALLAIILTAGIARLFGSRRNLALATWGGGFFALALGILFYLNSIYAAPPQDLARLPALGGATAPADFGNTIRVLDYRVEPARVAPGSAVIVTVYWQALQPPQENYWLLLQLANNTGAVANKDGVPSAGRTTTDLWRTNQVFASRHALDFPNDIAPGTYSLQLGLHPFGRWEWLPVRGQDMLTLGEIVIASK